MMWDIVLILQKMSRIGKDKGWLNSNTTFTYDAEGKLTRADRYAADGSFNGYVLYEYD